MNTSATEDLKKNNAAQDELRHRILEATIDEFNDKSLKFTMDDIAHRLSISKKTLYKVFSTKDELFMAMVGYCFDAIKQSERAVIENDSMDIVDKIRSIIIVLPEKYASIDFRQIWELQLHFPKVYEQVAHRLETDWEPTMQLLDEGIALGRIRPVSKIVFKMMAEASFEYFLRSRELAESNISYREALDAMIDIFMNGLVER